MTVLAAVIAIAAPIADAKPRAPKHKPIHLAHRKGDQSWQWRYDVWMPAVWQRIARCESGSNPPNWRHDSGTYQGAFGFYYGSWDAFKPVAWWPDNAADATPWQQLQVALRIHARYGFTGWGCYRHAWVRG